MENRLEAIWNSYRQYLFPISSLIAFFPVVTKSFTWLLPGEARQFIDTQLLDQIAFGSVAVLSIVSATLMYASKSINSLEAHFHQLEEQFHQGIKQDNLESTIKYLKPLFFITPVFVLLMYFGIVATIFFLTMIFLYLVAIASVLRRFDKRVDRSKNIWSGDFIYLCDILRKPTDFLVNKHVFFVFGNFVYSLAFSLSVAHMVSLLNNDSVLLTSINTEQSFIPVSHSTAGTLFLVSGDASIWKVVFTQKEKFVYVSNGGGVFCSENAGELCTLPP